MDLETLLTGTKWEIIELLSKESLSPLELARRLNTTIANISQQLRLLQTADLIKKKRTGSGKPGKPRMLFSLSDDYALILVFSKGYAKKKLVRISDKQKQMLKQVLKHD
jgi:DNA-binding transcriptional regulator GbsR (MarR family)